MKIYLVLSVLIVKRGEPRPTERKTEGRNKKILSIITSQWFSIFLRSFIGMNSIFDLLQFGWSIVITIFICSFSLLSDGFALTGMLFELFKISILVFFHNIKKNHIFLFSVDRGEKHRAIFIRKSNVGNKWKITIRRQTVKTFYFKTRLWIKKSKHSRRINSACQRNIFSAENASSSETKHFYRWTRVFMIDKRTT